jgi:inner membrane transporter RhtA
VSTEARDPDARGSQGSGGSRDSRARAGISSRATAGSAALVLGGIVSTQIGAGLAARLFHQAPPAAVTGLRLWAAAIVLLIVAARGVTAAVRGVARRRAWRDALVVLGFGLCLGAMNFVFYQAIARIPLGVAVTIEFLGPLAVAVAGSRRLLDLVWVGLAAAGVVLLTSGDTSQLNLAGIVFAALSAAGWAGYILFSVATGRRFTGANGLALAMIVAAVAVTPVAAVAASSAHRALSRPSVLLTGAGLGVLSSAIPYGLEMQALRRLPSRVFGIWMSVEPAVAALIGLALLGQHLSVAEWAAVGCVVAASIGAARAAPATSDAKGTSDAPGTSGAPATSDAPAPSGAPAVPAPPAD